MKIILVNFSTRPGLVRVTGRAGLAHLEDSKYNVSYNRAWTAAEEQEETGAGPIHDRPKDATRTHTRLVVSNVLSRGPSALGCAGQSKCFIKWDVCEVRIINKIICKIINEIYFLKMRDISCLM